MKPLLVFLLSLSAAAQQPWQHLQMPTAAEVQRTWNAPPPEYGPEPYYGLNGPVDLAVIRRDLDRMKSLGYAAVTVQAGYGMPVPYLSPEYFAFFKQFVAEAKQRSMRVWIVDDAGYPSGFAGGKFTTEHPELRMQALAFTKTLAPAGTQIRKSVSPDTVSVGAINSADGSIVPITVTNGAIDWTAPAGSWTVVEVAHVFRTSPTRSDTNPQRVKDASQSLEDYLDPAATAQYLAFTHEAYKKAVGGEFGKTILGFRGDEPDYSISGLPWTPKFFNGFQQMKGYDIRPYLAAFAPAKGAILPDAQQRARADYYDVFSQMFRDGFFKPQAEWCAANHLEYQVHLNHEEMEMDLTRSEGDFFRDMRDVQVPGIDSIWHQIWTDTISDFPRLASSAAHVYGHPRAFTESFAAYRPEPDVTMVRYILNEQFVRGINLVETMYYPATSTPARPGGGSAAGSGGGPAKYMQDPAYPALLAYVRRMSYLMSMGRPDASVALLLPSSSMWLGDAASDAQFVSAERLLSEHQIDFDIVDEDFLGAASKADPGAFTAASGNSYRTVIIPNAAVLSQAALNHLHTFTTSGGRVLFLGDPPKLIADRTILEARASTAEDFAWATIVPCTLPETPTPPAQPPTSPPTAIEVPQGILRPILSAITDQPFQLDAPDTALRYTHRKLKDAEVFFFFNESAMPLSHTLSFAASPHRAEEWNAESGAVSAITVGRKAGIPLSLKPYEARIIILR